MATNKPNAGAITADQDATKTDDQLAAEEKAKADAEAQAKSDAEAKAADEAEAKRTADEEAAKQAEQAILDMSLEARMARAKAALDEALHAQNQVNAIVRQRTLELDELIIESEGSADKNPMSDIQFYLNRQQRKREEKRQQRERMLENGLDPVELIKRLDIRAPIDQKQGARKVDPRAVKPVAAAKPAA